MPDAHAPIADLACATRIGGGTIRLLLSGDVDERRALNVRHSVISALRHHRPASIDVYLLDCTLVDAAGLRELQLCRAYATQLNCRLTFRQPSAPARRILEAAGLLRPACAAAVNESAGTPPRPPC